MKLEKQHATDSYEWQVIDECVGLDWATDTAINTGLTPNHFWDPDAGAIFGLMIARRRNNEPVNCGEMIDDIVDSLPRESHERLVDRMAAARFEIRTGVSAGWAARQVIEHWQEREAVLAGRQMLEAIDGGEDWQSAADQHSRRVAEIQQATGVRDIYTMESAVDALEDRETNPAAIHGTGLADIDRQINGGLTDGQLAIVGGRPGSGKSILTAQIAATFARRQEPALIVSLEMTRSEIAGRLAKTIPRDELRRLPIHIVDTTSNIDRIAGLIRLAHRRDGIRLVVLDYLQLAESSDRKANRERQVAEVSRTLKRLAMDLQIPVIAACQLNRESTKDNRRPRLSDLRESGAIEQDADIVGLLHRPDGDSPSEVIIAKNRNGAPGIVQLDFMPAKFRFENHVAYSGNL